MSSNENTQGRSIWHSLWQQNWLPKALRKHAYKRLDALDQAPDAPFEIDFYGLRYRGNLNNGIEFAIYFYGAFEKPLLYFLRDAMQAIRSRKDNGTNKVFVDVGANIGQHSLFMSRVADEIHAFEPYAAVSNKLREHIALNNIANITLHELGLSDSNGKLPFFAPGGSNKGVGSFDSDSQERGNTPAGELAIACGDEYFAQQGIEHVDLMKIDVEGFERKALVGLRETLERCRPLIACEITYGQPLSFKSREDLLACLPENYELWQFNTRKANGKTARRRGAKAKRSGAYELIPVTGWRDRDQDDLIAVPGELRDCLPVRSGG